MMKNASESSEFDGHIGCQEYTLPRDDTSSTHKGWIRESTKIGPVLEVVTNYHQRKPGILIRIEFLSGDEISIVGKNFERTSQIRGRFDREEKKSW